MPVEVIWDDEEKTIIRQIYSGVVVLDDYKAATDQFVEMANSVDHTVHSILDRREIEKSEGSFLKAMQYANKLMPDHVGMRIVMQPNRMTKTMINMGQYLAPNLVKNIGYAETIEEAHGKIADYLKSTP